jgi:hypothetical protein
LFFFSPRLTRQFSSSTTSPGATLTPSTQFKIKGTRRPSGQDSQLDTFFKQADWRKLQEYFLIEIFEDCLYALDTGANTCGALLRKWPQFRLMYF